MVEIRKKETEAQRGKHFFPLQASDGSRQESIHAEHLSQLRAVSDAQKTVNSILEIAQVLHYLDQVRKTFPRLYGSGNSRGWMFFRGVWSILVKAISQESLQVILHMKHQSSLGLEVESNRILWSTVTDTLVNAFYVKN